VSVNYALELKGTDFYYFMLAAVLLSGLYVSLMAGMAVSCSLAVCECSRSPIIVQKIILRDDIDNELVNELEKMFTQFQAMKIGFSACGLFSLDSTFFCGIIGLTLSYIFIIAQF
jgi:hypothetical protein